METPEQSKPRPYNFEVFDTPWLRFQVETHLIFGPVARRIPMALVMSVVMLCFFVYTLFNPFSGIVPYMDTILFGSGAILFPVMMRTWPLYHQAALGWCAVKCAGGFLAFVLMVIASLLGLVQGQWIAVVNFFLGFIWTPWLEFLPKVTPHQKWLTLARILLTIPLVYLGIRSGYWH